MRIRTLSVLTIMLFGVVLVVIGASVTFTSQQVWAATEQEKIASRIAQGASELGYLSNDYLIYREGQQLARWQARYSSFADQVASLQVDKPEQQVLVRNIQSSQKRMKEVFDSVVSGAWATAGNGGGAVDAAFLQVSWSRMAVQSQGLVSDASRLGQMLRDQADQARQLNIVVVFAAIVVFAAYFVVNYLLVQRRLLQSIVDLKAGALLIGSGDLRHRIEERRNDEIGELAHAFNQMAANLKLVTASKADLETEIAERKSVEAERQRLLQEVLVKNKELLAQSEEIQAANEELQAQAEEVRATNEELQIANTELARAIATAEEAVRARDEFLSVAAHELKTPVTGIRGFAQVVLRRLEKGGVVEPDRLSLALETIDRQSQKLASLVTKLLDISRLEGGRLKLDRQPTDMVNLVEEVAAAARLKTNQHEIVVEAPTRAQAFIDPLRIEQVITNLVDNAIRYSPDGCMIEVSVGGEQNLEIAVRDHGIGIAPEHREHVFERFYRADASDHIPGLGLGLFISSQIVELHGGRIELECPLDGGSRFTVSLPAMGDAGELVPSNLPEILTLA